jgi:hypothetical protein
VPSRRSGADPRRPARLTASLRTGRYLRLRRPRRHIIEPARDRQGAISTSGVPGLAIRSGCVQPARCLPAISAVGWCDPDGAVKLPVICRLCCLAGSASLIQGGDEGRVGTRRSADEIAAFAGGLVAAVPWHVTMSPDSFVTGPGDAMEWYFRYAAPDPAAVEVIKPAGAFVAGRRCHDVAISRYGGRRGSTAARAAGRCPSSPAATPAPRRPADRLRLRRHRVREVIQPT